VSETSKVKGENRQTSNVKNYYQVFSRLTFHVWQH